MENLVKEITERIVYDYEFKNPKNVLDFKDLVIQKEITYDKKDGKVIKTVSIWDKAIQKALDENECVEIPYVNEDIYLDSSIIMHSENKLRVDKNQRIAALPNNPVCLIRNENILDGTKSHKALDNPDCNIVIDGGIWDSSVYVKSLTNGNNRLRADKENSIDGCLAIALLSNIKDIIIQNAIFANSTSYAIQISNCEGVSIDNIFFENFFKDGVHLNGPAKYVHINNLKGKDMGDDMVAMNAWDWNTSAMSFGTEEKVLVENIYSSHNEFRLLPGRKTYIDNSFVDCKIKDCVIRNVSGVYTFKLYGQPNFMNLADNSEILGEHENIYFDNIDFPEVTSKGFSNLPVGGLFEVCADTNDLYFNNIKIKNTVDDFKKMGVSVIKAGPLSATWKHDPKNSDTWTEVFYPDDICTMKNTHIGKVEFIDKCATPDEKEILAKAIKLTVNPDYPKTTPKGGTGYGIIENIIFD